MKIIIYLFLCFGILVSCKKAKESPASVVNPLTGETQPSKFASFTIHFQSKAGTLPFALEKSFVNAKGESFKVSMLKYFIGNIKLKKPDGTSVLIADSYHLINAPTEETITVNNVPIGSYDGISFEIGVDSIHHFKKPEPGSTLDPTVHPDMNWIWGEGEYLFLKMTGTSPASKKDENFSYDIAGYQKNTNALQSVQNQFDVLMDVRQNAVPNIHYYVDILEVFKNPTDISIADLPYINSIGANAVMLSNNYKDMFIYQHIEN